MKKQELSWKAGGQQGEGLESLGEIFAAALCSLGYDVYGYRQVFVPDQGRPHQL